MRQTADAIPKEKRKKMKLVEFVPPVRHPLWRLCLQMGISDVIVKVNPDLTGLHPDDPCLDSLGRLFANGYLKALLKGTGN